MKLNFLSKWFLNNSNWIIACSQKAIKPEANYLPTRRCLSGKKMNCIQLAKWLQLGCSSWRALQWSSGCKVVRFSLNRLRLVVCKPFRISSGLHSWRASFTLSKGFEQNLFIPFIADMASVMPHHTVKKKIKMYKVCPFLFENLRPTFEILNFIAWTGHFNETKSWDGRKRLNIWLNFRNLIISD